VILIKANEIASPTCALKQASSLSEKGSAYYILCCSACLLELGSFLLGFSF